METEEMIADENMTGSILDKCMPAPINMDEKIAKMLE